MPVNGLIFVEDKLWIDGKINNNRLTIGVGFSGLLITPFNGPTCRLAAVYVSAENLPFAETNEHSWIRDYCE